MQKTIKHKKLNQLASTAICGNDISSSVLYVSALAIGFAGQYAWVTLLIVSGVLFLFRRIYGEVVGAIPLNGGAYNALLNTTSKSMASFAATLTILSYMATAVISGNEAIHYLHSLFDEVPIILSTILLLLFFTLLVIGGIKESARVAIFIFIFHLSSLFILGGFIGYYLFQYGFLQFFENWHSPLGNNGSIWVAIFLGFSASMLGVSGFESSANFVEEQKKDVFPKTLRNMWVIVSVANPLMAFFALSLFSLPELHAPEFQNTLLVEMGNKVGGGWIKSLIAIDAFLVLSGAVLTSFVGVNGLLERMTLDRIMPQFFLRKNKNGSSYRITIIFFLLCVSVLLFTEGNVHLLAGVYTISFLSVMGLFGIGNILLKIKRSSLPRPTKAPWSSVLIAIIAIGIALMGNIIIEPKNGEPSNLSVFLYYFIPFITFISIMLNRTTLLKGFLGIVRAAFTSIQKLVHSINSYIISIIHSINNQEFVFFTQDTNIAVLNKAMLYIRRNEHTKKVKIVLINQNGENSNDKFNQEINFLDLEYPEINVTSVILQEPLSPKLIQKLSKEWSIPVNFMFIASPGNKFPYRIEELGGVRLIL